MANEIPNSKLVLFELSGHSMLKDVKEEFINRIKKTGTSMKNLTGKCLCEAIAYEIDGELGTVVNCHCSECRRWHGAAFRTRCTIEKKTSNGRAVKSYFQNIILPKTLSKPF